jgi:hypothetical protein
MAGRALRAAGLSWLPVHLLRHLLKDGLLRFRIFNLLHAVQTAGKARFVAQHQAVELLIKLGKVIFCCSVIALSGRALPGKSLLKYCLRVPHLRIHALFKKSEHRIRYIALSLWRDCEYSVNKHQGMTRQSH